MHQLAGTTNSLADSFLAGPFCAESSHDLLHHHDATTSDLETLRSIQANVNLFDISVTQSIISSAGSIRSGQGPQVLIPQSVPGMIALSADPL